MAEGRDKERARAFWRMHRRQVWVLRGMVVLSCCLAGMISATIWTPQARTPQLLLLASLPLFALYWLKWRCVHCNKRLMQPILPSFCPQCGEPLKKEQK